MDKQLLIVDDEESIRYTFSAFFEDAGYRVDLAEDRQKAIDCMETKEYDAIFLDILLGQDSGIDVLKTAREMNPNTPVLMVTGGPEVSTAAEAVRYGAFDYILKPVNQDDLLRHASRATEYKRSLDETLRYQQRLTAIFNGIREGIMVFDSELTLIEMNYAAVEILGCCADGTGKKLHELIEISNNPVLSALRKLLEARVEGEIFQLNVCNTAGEPRQLGVSLSPLTTSAGAENDLVLVIRDESDQPRQAIGVQ
ncbi:MAG: response regulator [Desulfuromonadales bacterium]|nr:response regulator [Desulfuromonadales bacterium]